MESLGNCAVALQTEIFDRWTFPEGVQHVNRRNRIVLGDTTFERDETFEQSGGPGDHIRKGKDAEQGKTTRKYGRKANQRSWLFYACPQFWSKAEEFEVRRGAERGEKRD